MPKHGCESHDRIRLEKNIFCRSIKCTQIHLKYYINAVAFGYEILKCCTSSPGKGIVSLLHFISFIRFKFQRIENNIVVFAFDKENECDSPNALLRLKQFTLHLI